MASPTTNEPASSETVSNNDHPTPSTKSQATITIAPHPLPSTLSTRPSVFLAGSIDMGRATNWQAIITSALLPHPDLHILNPRRPDWGGDWPQDIRFPPFREQVEWELAAQEAASVIAMYFDPAGLAPVSLLELGLFARSGRLVVCCPEGYWRRGNVQVVCERYGVCVVGDLAELAREVEGRLGLRA